MSCMTSHAWEIVDPRKSVLKNQLGVGMVVAGRLQGEGNMVYSGSEMTENLKYS